MPLPPQALEPDTQIEDFGPPRPQPKYPFGQWVEEVAKDYPSVDRLLITESYLNRYGPPPKEEIVPWEEYLPQAKTAFPGRDESDIKKSWFHTYGVAQEAYNQHNPTDDRGDFIRSIGIAIKQHPELAHGISALAASTGENMFGEGGAFTAWKQSALQSYQDWQQNLAQDSKRSDRVTEAWKMATEEGDPGALVDWLQHAAGYFTGQIGTILGVAALASLAGGPATGVVAALGSATAGQTARQSILKQTIGKTIQGMIEREQAKLAASGLTGQELERQAVRNASKSLVSKAALLPYETSLELGEIGGESALQAAKEGRPLTGPEAARAVGAALVAGAVGAAGDVLLLKGGKGGLGSAIAEKPGLAGRAARAGTLGATEGAVEATQTAIEQIGTGHDPTAPESIIEQVDAAAQGAVSGGIAGTIHAPATPADQAKGRLAQEIEKLRSMSRTRKDELKKADAQTKAVPDKVGVFDPSVTVDEAITKAETAGELEPGQDITDIVTEELIDAGVKQGEAARVKGGAEARANLEALGTPIPEALPTLTPEVAPPAAQVTPATPVQPAPKKLKKTKKSTAEMSPEEALAYATRQAKAEPAPTPEVMGEGLPEIDLPKTTHNLGAFEGAAITPSTPTPSAPSEESTPASTPPAEAGTPQETTTQKKRLISKREEARQALAQKEQLANIYDEFRYADAADDLPAMQRAADQLTQQGLPLPDPTVMQTWSDNRDLLRAAQKSLAIAGKERGFQAWTEVPGQGGTTEKQSSKSPTDQWFKILRSKPEGGNEALGMKSAWKMERINRVLQETLAALPGEPLTEEQEVFLETLRQDPKLRDLSTREPATAYGRPAEDWRAAIPQDLQVTMRAIREDTNEEIEIQESATVALEELDGALSKYQQLWDCLRS